MKPLYEFLSDIENKMFVETFGSTVMDILNLNNIGGLAKNPVWKHKLANMFTWDKMTNEDFTVYNDGNVEELIKKIYKKSGTRNFVIWCDKLGDVIAYSDDLTYYLPVSRTLFARSVRGIGQKIAQMGGTAIEIIDPDKFQTSKLREQRRITKSGALALREADSIARENRLRYEEAISSAQGKKFDHADIVAKVQSVVDIYAELIKNMTNDVEILLQVKSWSSPLEDLQNDYQRILNDACEVLKEGQHVEDWEERHAEDLDNPNKIKFQNELRESLGRMMQEFNTKVAKFRTKYVEKY